MIVVGKIVLDFNKISLMKNPFSVLHTCTLKMGKVINKRQLQLFIWILYDRLYSMCQPVSFLNYAKYMQ